MRMRLSRAGTQGLTERAFDVALGPGYSLTRIPG